MNTKTTYLFSIDLEDIRFRVNNGLQYKERVPQNTINYLNWLGKYNFKCTFFTVGDVARAYPELIQEIINQGHEIGCHTNTHIPLTKMTKETFKKDISSNIESLIKAGATEIKGFRAPYFSLTKDCQWVYPILKDYGLTYSSSVYPGKNPFYSWENFGDKPKKIDSDFIEIPITVKNYGPIKAAFAGGVYFRVLPKFLINRSFKNYKTKNSPLLGYFHPYDIDTQQESFMHPDINESKFYNWLINFNRKNVFNRLDYIISKGFTITTYKDYIDANLI